MPHEDKENPGCWHDLLNYCSELTGLSTRIEKTLQSFDQTRKKLPRGRSKLMYSSYDIFAETQGVRFYQPLTKQIKGGEKIMYFGVLPEGYSGSNEFPLDFKFDRIGVIVRRPVEDYKKAGVVIHAAGNYKDWEGDGYFNVSRYRINNQYFADLSCNCGW